MTERSGTDESNLEYATEALPTYDVNATQQEAEWLLTAELPGSSVTHVVRSLDDPDWVTREMRTVIAAHLGIPDDSFELRLQT